MLKLLRGEIDVTQSSLSLAKERWLRAEHSDRFDILEREGVSVSYLAFNMRVPILANQAVRKAIAAAIDRDAITRDKLFGFATPAGSLLSPLLPESHASKFEYNPERAEALLDQAGYPRGKDGVRFHLRYKSTPVREGIETAQIIRYFLGKIGIDVDIDVVEPAVFLASVRKGAFELYSSRWLGISDGSILFRTLRSGRPDNRAGYSDPAMDRLLDEANSEIDLKKRAALLAQAQERMADELPYFPLWYWKTTAILRKGLTGLDKLSLSGAIEPLTHLRDQNR